MAMCTQSYGDPPAAMQWYLYHMGNTGDGVVQKPLNMLHRNNQRLGFVRASEWTLERFDKTCVDVSADPQAPDALMVLNPPLPSGDGGFLMIYKSGSKQKPGIGGGPSHYGRTSDSAIGPIRKPCARSLPPKSWA